MSDETPNAISGTFRTYQLLRDSTLRIVIDIDPRFKSAFHQMFRDNDVPIAIAPLAMNFERIEEKQKEEKRVGPLCRLACIWCASKEFWEWLGMELGYEIPDEESAADALRDWLQIDSRLVLDHDPQAAERFLNMVRTPFMKWMDDK